MVARLFVSRESCTRLPGRESSGPRPLRRDLYIAQFRAPRFLGDRRRSTRTMYTAPARPGRRRKKFAAADFVLPRSSADTRSASVRCLGPAPDETAKRVDNLSMVLRIAQAVPQGTPQAVLFAGDLEAAGERSLLAMRRRRCWPRRCSKAPIMEAARHLRGLYPRSAAAGGDFFRSATAPFQFPAPEVVERYVAAGAKVFRDRPQRRGECGPRQTSAGGAYLQHGKIKS